MKKGLLSILASALLVVGCQNYDDQFTLLENQITALTQTVSGLSEVKGTIATLSGTVNSLSSTVSGLGDAIDTAVAEGLADIQEDITAIEAAVADVASSEAVSELSDAVAASQEDLDELLANSSVFNSSVLINSIATLDVFHAMGSSLNIVNGDVTITMKTDMDKTKMQTVIDNILTITGDYSYTSEASSISEMLFTNLSGTQSLTVEQAGGYQFPALSTATIIDLGDAFENSVTKIDFRELTSVTNFKTEGVSNKIAFDKATELHLTKLPRYNNTSTSSSLVIVTDEGAAMPISALDDVDSSGEQENIYLDITGPASVEFTKINDGTITLTDVATASISGFIGDITVSTGVEVLTVTGGVSVDVSGATDLSSASLNMALDSDADLTATALAALPYGTQGDITFSSSADDLETITISGEAHDVSIDGLGNLTTLVVTAKLNDLTVKNNDDLTSVTVTGASINDVTVQSNSDLETLVLDYTTILTKEVATAATAAQVSITGNNKLTSLSLGADDIDSLIVTGNAKLATVNFTGLKDNGTSTAATVNIYDNKLTAESAVDDYQSTIPNSSDAEYATTADTGKYTTTSGVGTLSTYVADAITATTANVVIYFDEVGTLTTKGETSASDSESTPATVDWSTAPTTANANSIHAVVHVTPKATDTAATYQTQTFYIPLEDEIVEATQALGEADFNAVTDNIAIDYPALGVVSYTYDTTTRNTLSDYITWFNTEADKENFNATLSLTGNKQHYFTITYTNTDGRNGTVSGRLNATGNNVSQTIFFDFGTDTGLSTQVVSGDGPLNIASRIADVIHGLGSFTAKVMGTDNAAHVVVGALNESEQDITPVNRVTLPTSLTVSRTYTGGTGNLASWSANATNAETSYTLTFGAGVARYSGLLLNLKHTNTAADRFVTVMTGDGGVTPFFGTASALSAGSFYANGDVDGVSTTSVDSQIGGYVRAYSLADGGATGAAGENTNRISWGL